MSGLVWFGSVWFGLVWFWLVGFGFGLVRPALVLAGLAWLSSDWFGLSGLVGVALPCLAFPFLALPRLASPRLVLLWPVLAGAALNGEALAVAVESWRKQSLNTNVRESARTPLSSRSGKRSYRAHRCLPRPSTAKYIGSQAIVSNDPRENTPPPCEQNLDRKSLGACGSMRAPPFPLPTCLPRHCVVAPY